MKIAVTGANGYLGRNLVPYLRANGHAVTALTRADGDLADDVAPPVLRTMSIPDVLIHLAARVRIDLAPNAQGETQAPIPGRLSCAQLYRNNVLATANVADYCRTAGVQHLILASTLAVSGMGDGPLEHYAASKLAAESVVFTAARAGDLRVTVLRLPGVFGGDRQTGAIWGMCHSAITHRGISVYAPYPLPYHAMHMDDVLTAFGRAITRSGKSASLWSISDGLPSSLMLWAQAIAAEARPCTVIASGAAQPELVRPRVPDTWMPRPRAEQIRQLLAEVKASLS